MKEVPENCEFSYCKFLADFERLEQLPLLKRHPLLVVIRLLSRPFETEVDQCFARNGSACVYRGPEVISLYEMDVAEFEAHQRRMTDWSGAIRKNV